MGKPTVRVRRACIEPGQRACGVVLGALLWATPAASAEPPPTPEAPATPPGPPASPDAPARDLPIPPSGAAPGESAPASAAEPAPPAPAPPAARPPEAPQVTPERERQPEAPPAEAEAPPEPELESPVQIHGFVSQGFIKSSGNNFLANSKRGSFEFTEVGVNFTKEITDNFRIGAQLFARDLGPIGNYSAQLDWFYFDYRFFDWLGIRAGRTKLPFGLYNETSDIDAARVPILLPQSVYPITSRDFLLAQTGVELYGLVPVGEAGDLDYRAYGGTLFFDFRYEGAEDTVKKIDVPYVFGGRLMWRTPVPALQLGGSLQALKLDIDYEIPGQALAGLKAANQVPATFDGVISARIPATLSVASVEYAPGDLLLAGEYARWHTKLESSLPTVYPDSSTWSERFYVMGSYRVNPWLVPGAYYAAQFPDVDWRSGRQNHLHDFAATVRFDINAHWLLKLEGHFMRGTAGLSPELNDGATRDTLTRDWGVFLAKTTAYF